MKFTILLTLIFAFAVHPCFAQNVGPLFIVFVKGKYGYIDKAGRVIIDPRFDSATGFSEGLALVSMARKKAFIDRTGKIIIEAKGYDPINNFTDGLSRVNITNRSKAAKGYIDKTGEIVIDDPNIWGACEFSEGLACVVAGKWGYIDISGKYVIKAQFDEASYFREGMAAVTLWDKSGTSQHNKGFIDKTGKVVIKAAYDVVQPFSEGLAAVGMITGDVYRFGFIDKTGVMIIEPQFEWTYCFKEGLAAAKIGGKWGFVDKEGRIVIPPRFDKAEYFSEGLAPVATKGKWGFIDKKGNFVIEPKFNEAGNFTSGLAFVKIGGYDAYETYDVIGHFDRDGKWGYIDKTGKYIWKPTN